MSRLNELVRDRRFASQVIDAWLGNSEKVRRDHSLLVTDADYQAAVSGAGEISAQIGTLTVHERLSGAVNASRSPRKIAGRAENSRKPIPSTGIEPVTFNFGG